MPVKQAAQIPAHPTEADPLAAFVASLTPEQRVSLVQLLNTAPDA